MKETTKIADLNQEQLAVIHNRGNNQIVTAPAGTGKTTVISKMIEYLCSKDNIPEEDILCVTFTNKARNEMVQKIVQKNIDIRTMHSFYFKIVQTCSGWLGYSTSDVVVIPEIAATEMAERILISMRGPRMNRNFIYRFVTSCCESYLQANGWAHAVQMTISNYKTRYYIGAATNKEWENWLKVNGVHLMEQYVNLCIKSGVVDFGLLEVFAQRLSFEDRLREILSHYKYVLIDEIQDMSKVQFEILLNLFPQCNFTVFGDMNQTIYTWRGSDPKHIHKRMIEDLGSVQTILFENFRSHPDIVYFGQAFLDVFKGTDLCQYLAKPSSKMKVLLSGNDCASHIINIIEDWHEKYPEDKLAILSRNHSNMDIISKESYRREIMRSQVEESNLSKDPIEYAKPAEFNSAGKVVLKDLDEPNSKHEEVQIMFPKDFKMNESLDMQFLKMICALTAYPTSEFHIKRLLSKFGISQDINVHDFTLLATGQYTYDPYHDYYEPLIQSLDNKRLWVFDLETTSKDPYKARIVQLCAHNPLTKETVEVLVNPDVPVGESCEVHGFTDTFLDEHGEHRSAALNKAKELFDGTVVVGHNVNYDITVLNEELAREGMEQIKPIAVYDTLLEARYFLKNKDLRNFKLDTLREYFGVKTKANHNAVQDVLATVGVLANIIARYIRPNREALHLSMRNTMDSYKYILCSIRSQVDQIKNFKFDEVLSWAFKMNLGITQREDTTSEDIALLHEEQEYLRSINLDAKSYQARAAELYAFLDMTKGEMSGLLDTTAKVPAITIHQSKGCEFDRVVIFDYDGAIKFGKSVTQELDEEEFRIFYVALTRAKKEVIIVTNATDKRDIPQTISMMPEDIIEFKSDFGGELHL